MATSELYTVSIVHDMFTECGTSSEQLARISMTWSGRQCRFRGTLFDCGTENAAGRLPKKD